MGHGTGDVVGGQLCNGVYDYNFWSTLQHTECSGRKSDDLVAYPCTIGAININPSFVCTAQDPGVAAASHVAAPST